MKRLLQLKKIIIPFNGKIGPLGVMGPIDVPYYESIENIASLIMARYKVYEVLKDGQKVLLTINNYDIENGAPGNESMVQKYTGEKLRRNHDNEIIVVSDDDLKKKSDTNLLKKSTEVQTAVQKKDLESQSADDKKANKVFINSKKKKHQREDIEMK